MHKKLLLLTLLGADLGFAGTMGAVCQNSTTLPCDPPAWSLAGKALYLQPFASRSPLGTQITVTNSSPAIDYKLGSNPSYSWGFELEGAYRFDSGSDLNLNWYELNQNNHFSNQVDAYGVTLPFNVGGTDVFLEPGNVYAQDTSSWNMVNLEFGQQIDLGVLKNIRLHGGGTYARLSSTFSYHGNIATKYNLPGFAVLNFNPTYNGFGPRVGVDLMYALPHEWNVYAKMATAILAGSSNYSNRYTNFTNDVYGTNTGSTMVIVPEIDGKIGLSYGHTTTYGDVVFDAGWLWMNYFNIEPSATYTPNNRNDFGLQGVYFGLKWTGNLV